MAPLTPEETIKYQQLIAEDINLKTEQGNLEAKRDCVRKQIEQVEEESEKAVDESYTEKYTHVRPLTAEIEKRKRTIETLLKEVEKLEGQSQALAHVHDQELERIQQDKDTKVDPLETQLKAINEQIQANIFNQESIAQHFSHLSKANSSATPIERDRIRVQINERENAGDLHNDAQAARSLSRITWSQRKDVDRQSLNNRRKTESEVIGMPAGNVTSGSPKSNAYPASFGSEKTKSNSERGDIGRSKPSPPEEESIAPDEQPLSQTPDATPASSHGKAADHSRKRPRDSSNSAEFNRKPIHPRWPTVIRMWPRQAWVAINCKICTANANSDGTFLNGLSGLKLHVQMSHKDGKEVEIDTLDEWCNMHDIKQADVNLMLKGEEPTSLSMKPHTEDGVNKARQRHSGVQDQKSMSIDNMVQTPAHNRRSLEDDSGYPDRINGSSSQDLRNSRVSSKSWNPLPTPTSANAPRPGLFNVRRGTDAHLLQQQRDSDTTRSASVSYPRASANLSESSPSQPTPKRFRGPDRGDGER